MNLNFYFKLKVIPKMARQLPEHKIQILRRDSGRFTLAELISKNQKNGWLPLPFPVLSFLPIHSCLYSISIEFNSISINLNLNCYFRFKSIPRIARQLPEQRNKILKRESGRFTMWKSISKTNKMAGYSHYDLCINYHFATPPPLGYQQQRK